MTCMYACMFVCMYTYTYVCMYVLTYKYNNIWICSVHTCGDIHTYIQTYRTIWDRWPRRWISCTHSFISLRKLTGYMHILYICMYVSKYVCMYVCMYVCKLWGVHIRCTVKDLSSNLSKYVCSGYNLFRRHGLQGILSAHYPTTVYHFSCLIVCRPHC